MTGERKHNRLGYAGCLLRGIRDDANAMRDKYRV